MAYPQLVVRSGPLARVLLTVLATGMLVSCSSNESGSEGTAASTSAPPRASATSAVPTASPTTSLPAAADGENTRACADGTCEIRVSSPAKVPLPARLGLGPLEVTAIEDETVSMVAPLIQPEFASDGVCEGTVTGPGAGISGNVALICHVGKTAVLNKVSLEVVGIDIADQAAVLRIRPAK